MFVQYLGPRSDFGCSVCLLVCCLRWFAFLGQPARIYFKLSKFVFRLANTSYIRKPSFFIYFIRHRYWGWKPQERSLLISPWSPTWPWSVRIFCLQTSNMWDFTVLSIATIKNILVKSALSLIKGNFHNPICQVMLSWPQGQSSEVKPSSGQI